MSIFKIVIFDYYEIAITINIITFTNCVKLASPGIAVQCYHFEPKDTRRKPELVPHDAVGRV
ncbi:hypothetical protein MASR2M47_22400 [Draconibacterium sp.]